MKREAQIFKALSEEIRLRIMILLIHGEMNVRDIVHVTGLPQSTVSRHLSYLKNNGLIVMRTENVHSLYGIYRKDEPLLTDLFDCFERCFKDNGTVKWDKTLLRDLNRTRMGIHKTSNAENILFVCVHNAARSQMAEAFANALGGPEIAAFSAGFEPSGLNSIAIEVMEEAGISIKSSRSKDIYDIMQYNRNFDYVITVCNESEGERCPVFHEKSIRLHWDIEDPSNLTGTHEDKLKIGRLIRDRIKKNVEDLIESFEKN